MGRFQFSPWLPPYLALLFLLVPAKLLFSIILSIIIHELCHIIAIKLFGLPIRSMRIGLMGAKIVTGPMQANKELICAAAGPFGNLIALLFYRCFPLLSICCLFHCIINLLPIGSLDGARILRCALDNDIHIH